MNKQDYWNEIYARREEVSSLLSAYWHRYSHVGTWQFWVAVAMLTIPLIVLYFALDRKKIWEVLFFGYTIHMLWNYADTILELDNYFVHTYMLAPFLPFGISSTASFLPVAFLLVYQYCINHNKNFYLYALLMSCLFAFGFAVISKMIGILHVRKGMNQFHLLLIDVAVAYCSYWLTKLVMVMKNGKGSPGSRFIIVKKLDFNKYRIYSKAKS
ncbi:hypothetical protein PAESOLCIP111_01958 [Paenibacillus solanacearum]|uniref:Uncharacterized protein n=1 Tax=Paenibacillus solanacearum TaxID=2048548 RepID=A0A916JZA4_9BACL|nr:hypothetical protein [Paenibacillus solanacearum]CAG7616912.1 hypothetical protein PAESOLCIP111_01958 [Paenibacillus solanacearum]